MIKHYFTCGNTSKGFINFFDSNLNPLRKLYILKGGPGTGKSTLMKKAGESFSSSEHDIEYIHCSSDPDSLDGVIIRDLQIGIVDGTAPHVIEPKAPGAIEEYVNLGSAWNTSLLAQHAKQITYLQQEIHDSYPKAYNEFALARKIHDEWEQIYIQNMNFKKADALTDTLIHKILGNDFQNKTSVHYHRFFGASTPKGSIDYISTLIQPINKRYFIKGRPGSGKSTLLKKLVSAASSKGFDCEIYHCGFDPESLDMVLLPELSICIFDSTAPHEYEPSQPTDEIIDMYSQLILPDTDSKYRIEIEDIVKRYKTHIQNGTQHLAYSKMLHDELEKFYINATDFSIIDKMLYELIKKMHTYQ